MAQHSRAPWEAYDANASSGDEPTVFAGKHCIATFWINDIPHEEAVANAKLFAAAPELLAALKGLLESPDFELSHPVVERGSEKACSNAVSSWDRFVAAGRAAIADAEGRS